ncbi:MAG: ECF-type sigma factor [Pirellulaceae bacterium]
MPILSDIQTVLDETSNDAVRSRVASQLDDSSSMLRKFLDAMPLGPLGVALLISGRRPLSNDAQLVGSKSTPVDSSVLRHLTRVIEQVALPSQLHLAQSNRTLTDNAFKDYLSQPSSIHVSPLEFYQSFCDIYTRLLVKQATQSMQQREGTELQHDTDVTPEAALSTTIGDTVTRPERILKIHAGLDRLKKVAPEFALPFMLAVFAGRHYDEIAALLDTTTANVHEWVDIAAVEISMG